MARRAAAGLKCPAAARFHVKAELALGAKFAPQSYHDFIIAQGLLPPNLLEKAVMDGYVKSQLQLVGSR